MLRQTNEPRGLWDEEKSAVGTLWTSQDGGSQWQRRHEAPGRVLLLQSLPGMALAVRAVYAADRNPPLKHELEAFAHGGGAPRTLGAMPALVTGICFLTAERGYVWSAQTIYKTDTGGLVWSKIAQRTPDPIVATIQSVRSDGSVYFIRAKQVFRYPPLAGAVEQPLGGLFNAQAEAVCVDREQDTVVVAAKESNRWICAFYKDDMLELVEEINRVPVPDTQAHYMHASDGKVTLVTITTRTFLAEYGSYLRSGGWRREDISGARNLGALAFAGERAWVARRSAREEATKLYRRL
jgi:hypothetical protein